MGIVSLHPSFALWNGNKGEAALQDHLDKETSVSVDLTETGVKAKAQSRFVAAVDRLGGNLAELVNAPIERRVARQRAVSVGEVKLVEAVTAFGIEKLAHDREFAERTAERYFKNVFKKQQNKDRVLSEALEDLRNVPPDEAASTSGEEELNEEFLNRFEQYAEQASTEQLRQKWGRVLSAEVRAPGTFSPKVLRTVDEIDSNTAALFEKVCESSFNGVIPKCLSGVLEFGQLTPLVSAGLLLDPGLTGHIYRYVEVKDSAGQELWIMRAGDRAITFPKRTSLPANDANGPVIENEAGPSIPVYLLTDSGNAIFQILSRHNAFSKYVAKLKGAMLGVAVVEHVILPNGMTRALP